MIGAKSIVLNLKVTNNKNGFSPYKVQVQANKNYGLCDVVLPGTPVEPEKTYINLQKEDRKKEKVLYDARKAEYDKEMAKRKAEYDKEMAKRKGIRNAILDKFQGRQLNDEVIVESLKNTLYNLLNTAEL
jgi:hypothetical protein